MSLAGHLYSGSSRAFICRAGSAAGNRSLAHTTLPSASTDRPDARSTLGAVIIDKEVLDSLDTILNENQEFSPCLRGAIGTLSGISSRSLLCWWGLPAARNGATKSRVSLA
jgi:hypothetical protein